MHEGLKFGTSGLRGLVSELVGGPAGDYAAAFLMALEDPGEPSRTVLIGRDLRSSSAAIAGECAAAAVEAGFAPVDCGALPTPALALAAMERRCAAIMVTGSHIPEDRNGLKFYRPDGEITKADEAAILAAHGALDRRARVAAPAAIDATAIERYRQRYLRAFAPDALRGLRVAVYQQSSVARDLLSELLTSLGARVTDLARSDRFIPVDTEAHRTEDVTLIAGWGGEGRFDAIVSTDGDGDRPLIADETGAIIRGDVVGLLTAKYLHCGTIVTPVTSGSAIEASGVAIRVVRTRVGSPFVIAGMDEATIAGETAILGFEANGGVLLGSDFALEVGPLEALPTRDALLPILCVLASAVRVGRPVSQIVVELKPGHMVAHRLQSVPAAASTAFLSRLSGDAGFRDGFMLEAGVVSAVDEVDGVRMVLGDGSIVHFRASGNAPELRCYIEAADPARAAALLEWGLSAAEREVR